MCIINESMDASQKQILIAQVKQRHELMTAYLSEKDKRLLAASEAVTNGRGGDTIVSKETGISRGTISKGKKEIINARKTDNNANRVRKSGGGRKRLVDKNPALIKELDQLIDPAARRDPESPLRWTCQSTYKSSKVLRLKGYKVSQKSVYSLLQEMGYSMQSNRKIMDGKHNPDRDAQFHFINKKVKNCQADKQPVIKS